jgi:glycosyltransferase involved in cell wall biosynthesis
MSGRSNGGRIRILYFYPYLNFDTGSPKAMVQFIDALDRNLFEPVFYSPGDGPLTEALAARGIEIIRGEAQPISLGKPVAAVSGIQRQIAMLRAHRIDVLHANGFFWNEDLILGARLSGLPVILHVHNPVEIAFQNLCRFAARRVLFCSGANMRVCGNFDRIARKSEVFYNIVDTSPYQRAKPARERFGIEPGQIAIGTVAQIVRRKGIDTLLDAARIVLGRRDDVVFLIAGPPKETEPDFGQRMFAAASEPGLRGRVKFLGSRSDIPEFMASLDVFALASRAEPLGLVVLEAIAAGVPVVASRVGGIPEIIDSDQRGILVDPESPQAFAAAITEIIDRPDRGRAMAMAARGALPKFDAINGRARLTKLYKEAVSAY